MSSSDAPSFERGKPGDLICKLAEVRVAARLTRDELAQMVGTTRVQIHRLEEVKQAPGLPLAMRLSRVLGVAIEQLWYVPSYDALETYSNPAPEAPFRRKQRGRRVP